MSQCDQGSRISTSVTDAAPIRRPLQGASPILRFYDSRGDIFKWYGANTDIEDRKRAEALLAAEKRTLEMIANGASLADILERLCDTIDAQDPKIRSAVMLMDANGMHFRPAAGPRLPKNWLEAISPKNWETAAKGLPRVLHQGAVEIN